MEWKEERGERREGVEVRKKDKDVTVFYESLIKSR
jgi:hypothetical protein